MAATRRQRGRKRKEMPLGILVARILQTQLQRAEKNRAGAAKCRNPERIHDMRVALRRARTALKLFAPCAAEDDWRKVRKELARVAGYLGAVRDYDVGLAAFDALCSDHQLPEEDVRELREALCAVREEHVVALRKILEGKRTDEALAGLAAAARQARRCETRAARGSAREYLAAAVLSAVKDVLASGDEDVTQLFAEHLHQLRIAFKRLRYTCEFAHPVFGKIFDEFIEYCVKIQDCLGRHQDLASLCVHLEDLARRLRKKKKAHAGVLLTCGAVLERARAAMARERAAFAELWREFPAAAEIVSAKVRETAV